MFFKRRKRLAEEYSRITLFGQYDLVKRIMLVCFQQFINEKSINGKNAIHTKEVQSFPLLSALQNTHFVSYFSFSHLKMCLRLLLSLL